MCVTIGYRGHVSRYFSYCRRSIMKTSRTISTSIDKFTHNQLSLLYKSKRDCCRPLLTWSHPSDTQIGRDGGRKEVGREGDSRTHAALLVVTFYVQSSIKIESCDVPEQENNMMVSW